MSIKSNAFGGVTLSGKDAKKFKNQVVYGKPKQAAKDGVKRGVVLSRAFDKDGKVSFVVKLAVTGATDFVREAVEREIKRREAHPRRGVYKPPSRR